MMLRMKSTMIIRFFNLFMFVLVFFCPALDAQKGCSARRMDDMDSRMAKVLAIGEHGRPYPETKKALKGFCDDSSSYVKSLEDYSKKCFRGTLRQYSNIFIFSSKQSIKRFCGRNNKQANSLIQAAKCFNRNRTKMNKCMDKMTLNFVGIKYAQDSHKIPMICCQYVELNDCFRDALGNDCNEERQLMDEVLRSVSGNFVDSTCGEYNDDTDKCSKLPKIPSPKPNEKSYKSLLFPVYDIINSIKE